MQPVEFIILENSGKMHRDAQTHNVVTVDVKINKTYEDHETQIVYILCLNDWPKNCNLPVSEESIISVLEAMNNYSRGTKTTLVTC